MAQESSAKAQAKAVAPTDYRRFTGRVAATATAWFDKPIQTLPVSPRSDWTGSHDGARLVDMAGDRKAWVKPKPAKASKTLVAREKIVSDLAMLLGLPVPPVVIRRPMAGWPHYTATSLVCSTGKPWKDGGKDKIATLAPFIESLFPLWVWTADEDHNNHPDNLMWELGGGGPVVLSIDHAHALNFNGHGNVLTITPCQGYGTATLSGCAAVRAEIADRIEALDWAKIEHVVRRLGELLTPSEQDAIVELLRARRGELRSLLRS